jgi:hypothetical protein
MRTHDPRHRARNIARTQAYRKIRRGSVNTAAPHAFIRLIRARAVEHGAQVVEADGRVVNVSAKWMCALFDGMLQDSRCFQRQVARSLVQPFQAERGAPVSLTRRQVKALQNWRASKARRADAAQ